MGDRQERSLKQRFFAPKLGRYGLVCLNRVIDCLTRWGLSPENARSNCSKCGRFGHETKWCRVPKKELLKPPFKRGRVAHAIIGKRRVARCWTYGQVGHFSRKGCWFCREPVYLERNYPLRTNACNVDDEKFLLSASMSRSG